MSKILGESTKWIDSFLGLSHPWDPQRESTIHMRQYGGQYGKFPK